MIDTYIYIVDDFLFFCMGAILLYLFVLAIASHLKRSQYAKSRKQYRCAVLVREGSILPVTHKEEPCEFITYNDLVQDIKKLDRNCYDLVILLSEDACALSPHIFENIFNVYDAGIQAIQLHTVLKDHKGFKKHLRAVREEINNSLFRLGNTQLELSSGLSGVNMAFDLTWLQDNLRTVKTNLERKLFRQNIYIEYLPDAIVYCESIPNCPYRRRIRKTVSYLLPSLLEGNWSFVNRIMQKLIPSPSVICIFTVVWTLFTTGYAWNLSIKWWLLLFGLAITYSLAIPDYLVDDKKKKKHSIWKRH